MRILFIQVGLGCNNRCAMCAGTWTSQHVLSTPEVLLRLRAGREHGFDEVVLSGGEPTIRRDIIMLVAAARQLGYPSIVLQTNARRLSNADFACRLTRAGVTRYLVSLHGATAAQHELQTGVPGSFDQAVSGIRNISVQSHGSARIAVHTVILPSNYMSLTRIVDLVCELNIPMLKLSYVVPVGRASGIYDNQQCASMTVVLPHLTAAIDRFVLRNRGIPKTSVSIGYMPLCILAGYERFSDEISPPPTFVLDDNLSPRLADERIREQGLKVKGSSCLTCRHESACTGVWREYPAHFGWGEFTPGNS